MQIQAATVSRSAGQWLRPLRHCLKLLVPAAAVLCTNAMAGITVFEATGESAAAITPTRDAFRVAVGGGTALTVGVPGDFGGLRREINWDGVPDGRADPNLLPGNFFNVNSPRGVVFSTTGTGFLVSANACVTPALAPPCVQTTPLLFGFPGDLVAFSAQKVFGIVGSNVMDIKFFVPGTTTAATTSAFASVFVDLENNDTIDFTTMQFFDKDNVEIFNRKALATNVTKSLSFLGGVANAGERIAKVTITTPDNFLLSNGVRSNEIHDFVIMDDFIYATPAAIPEPGIWAMVLLGLGVVGWRTRKRA